MNSKLLIFRKITSKASKIKLINKLKNAAHQRNIDEKAMFGGVIEYKAKRKQRENKEKKVGIAAKIPDFSPNSEAYWLQNLSSKHIKVYRKTPTGRYKEIDKGKLFKQIKSENEIKGNISISETSSNHKISLLPNIVVRNLTKVPMLSSHDSSNVTHVEEEKKNYPSVTRVLNDTMSDDAKNALENWKQKMIAEMGEEGFQLFNKGKNTRDSGISKINPCSIRNHKQLSFGARFHLSVKQKLLKNDLKLDDDLKNVWNSVQHVLLNLNDVKLVEASVVHPKLKYKGIVDCVASYKNIPSVIEWKVSQKAKPQLAFTYDAPLQLSAYLGALSYDAQHLINLRNGVVVVAYKDGSPAEVFPMDEQLCRKYWAVWLKRLQLYWQSLT